MFGMLLLDIRSIDFTYKPESKKRQRQQKQQQQQQQQ